MLCFGAAAPLAPLLARRVGIARTAALLLAAIAAGLAVRATGGFAVLLAGTTLAAAGAACGNVLLPVIVRRSFADRIGMMSALYTTALVGVAALSAGLTVPIAHVIGEGWRGGLASWALLALAALALWLPRALRERGRPVATSAHVRIRDVTRDRLTWQLTAFFAVQSWGFYTLVAWMPSIFESHGIGTTDAGFLLGLSGAMAIPAALFVPRLAARGRDQRGLAFWLTALLVFGYGGLLLAPAAAPALWAVMTGAAQGSCFPLALTMIVLRSGSPSVASSLSTHVQSIGYLLAASGPLVGGALHDATGSWTATLAGPDGDARAAGAERPGRGPGAGRERRSGVDLLARVGVDDADRARRARLRRGEHQVVPAGADDERHVVQAEDLRRDLDAVAVGRACIDVDHGHERHVAAPSVRWLRRSRNPGSALGRPTAIAATSSPARS